MKQFLLVLTLVSCSIFAFGQIEFGVKAGLNSMDLVSDGIKFNQDDKFYDLNFNSSNYGHHFGLYGRVKILMVYVEPSILFNSNKVTYTLGEYGGVKAVSKFVNETYNSVDLPVMIGLKAGIIRLYAGPVAHLHINSKSDLIDFDGYEQRFKSATYGYQAGFGFDLWKLRLDVAYEGNLSNFGDHITIGGESFSFNDSAARLLGTVSYKF
ncbi:MAG TPA: outer membrane beta-barrel protein [Saprospiraceae bacterium]|nr:outer membrane beta-barrel protein [Saprospiraceae bacterium]